MCPGVMYRPSPRPLLQSGVLCFAGTELQLVEDALKRHLIGSETDNFKYVNANHSWVLLLDASITDRFTYPNSPYQTVRLCFANHKNDIGSKK